ncbi:MAG: hypothetical protein ACR2LJ_04285 [Acidimicrobiales bacterium]
MSVALMAGLAVGCSGGGGSSARLSVSGKAEVATGGGSARSVDGSRTLHAGDRVKVDAGSAVIRLSGDRQVELRTGSEVSLSLSGPSGSSGSGVQPSLVAGDLLVTAPGAGAAASVTATVADSVVSVSGGSARLTRGSATTVASYDAQVTVASAGRSLNVAPLRQVAVPAAGLLPGKPSPLIFKSGDSWDRRFLGDAIDLGNQLVARSRGFTAQLGPGEGHTTGFYRQILPALENEPSFDVASVGADRSPGEALVGLAIAVAGTRRSFTDRVATVFAFHDDGAAWGLVARDQGVARAPLLSGVDEAIGRGPLSVAEGRPQASAPASGSSSRSRAATTPPPPPPPSSGGGSTAGPAPASPSSPTASTPGSPLNVGAPLDNTVNSLVNVLNGLLGGLGGR